MESDKRKYSLLEVLEENIKKIKFLKISSIRKSEFPINAFQIVDINGNLNSNFFGEKDISKQFAFDASSGEFVTDKVLFGSEYARLNHHYMKKN